MNFTHKWRIKMKIDLRLGDCREILKTISDNSVDMVITSPPYDNLRTYENTLNWNFDIFKEIANELFRVLKIGGVIIWVVADATINGSELVQVLDKPFISKKLA